MANSNISKSKQKEIKELIELGRKQGYLTVSAINDLLPNNQYDNDQIEQITKLITEMLNSPSIIYNYFMIFQNHITLGRKG